MRTVLLLAAVAIMLVVAIAAVLTDSAAMVMGALALAAGAWFMTRNYLAMILVYSILPTIPIGIPGTFLTPFIVATPLAMVAAAFHYKGRWQALSPPPQYLVPMVAMVLLVIIAEMATPYATVINPVVNLAGALVIGTIVNGIINTDKDLRYITLAIVANLLLLAGSAASEMNWAEMQVDQIRVSGLAGEPNVLGMHLGRMMPVAAAVMLERDFKPWQRAAALVAVLLAALSLIGTASRTGAVAVVLSLTVVTLAGARTMRGKLIGFGVVIAGLALLMYFAPASFQTRVLEPAGLARGTTLDVNKSDVTSGRLDQLPLAFAMLEEHPLLGIGTSGFYTENANHYTGITTALHNAYLSIPVSYGLLAGVVFLFAVASSVVAGFRAIRYSRYPMLTAAIASGALSTAVALSAYPEPYRGWLWLAFILPHSFLRISNVHKKEAELAASALPLPRPAPGQQPSPVAPRLPTAGPSPAQT